MYKVHYFNFQDLVVILENKHIKKNIIKKCADKVEEEKRND